ESWFKERVEVHTALRDFAAEVKAGTKIQTGLPWLGKLFMELTNKINIGSSYREELRLVVRNNFTEFAEAFNQLIRAGEEKIRAAGKGKRILFTVDGTDRLDQEDAPKFFVEDVHQLTQINGLFIYCAPIHLLHQDNCLSASFCQPFRLPMLKVRDRDGEDLVENMAVMREMALRRVPEQLFDTLDTVDYLVRYSGGHPRDLLRLLNVAINYADEERIDQVAAEKAVKQVANEYRRFINTEDYTRLVQIDLHPDAPDDFTDEQSSLMLYNLILLEYNDYFWKSHPLISTLPGYQKAMQATGCV
ncbi:MAG: ATP-binding protein, partial [Candidatus Electrothrix sp. LOE1_4_5]|nr:ATP-binding protein [Candidatus Electrothrix gigas]